jgi:hypothetical protein
MGDYATRRRRRPGRLNRPDRKALPALRMSAQVALSAV